MRSAKSRDITILLVDDEKKFLDSISERIRLKGFEPISVSSGEDAVDVARKTNIDMAIVDLNMPGIDGLTTITKLKELHPAIKNGAFDRIWEREDQRSRSSPGIGLLRKG